MKCTSLEIYCFLVDYISHYSHKVGHNNCLSYNIIINLSTDHQSISDIILKLYKPLVCPLLEYNNLIWGPHYVMDKQNVEAIQRRATRMISTCCDLPYFDQLQHLNLYHRYIIEDVEEIYCFRTKWKFFSHFLQQQWQEVSTWNYSSHIHIVLLDLSSFQLE